MHLRTADAAQASGVPLNTLQRWLERGTVKMMPCDQPCNGQGTARGFSRRRVIQLAVMSEITSLGVSPSKAAKAAFHFTDRPSQRLPGQCALLGSTWLVGLVGGGTKIVDVPPDRTIADELRRISSAWVVNLTKIVRRVDAVLEGNNEAN